MTNQIAFLFPGQGSQSVGMLAEMNQQNQTVQTHFGEATEVLDYDLWHVVEQNPDDQLNQTQYTQPALLTASVGLYRAWIESGAAQAPAIMAGHSLGEYSALVCARAMHFSDALRIAALRGKLMQQAVQDGAMAAIIGLEDQKVDELCQQISSADAMVSCANYNCPLQVVVSGHKSAVLALTEAAKEAGAKIATVLPVSVPSHCELMRGAAKQLGEALNDIEIVMPTVPVIHNVDASVASSVEDIKQKLIQQLYSPVLWTQSMQALLQQDIAGFVECGPGKVLQGLMKRIDRKVPGAGTATPEQWKAAIEKFAK